MAIIIKEIHVKATVERSTGDTKLSGDTIATIRDIVRKELMDKERVKVRTVKNR